MADFQADLLGAIELLHAVANCWMTGAHRPERDPARYVAVDIPRHLWTEVQRWEHPGIRLTD